MCVCVFTQILFDKLSEWQNTIETNTRNEAFIRILLFV